MLSTCWGSAFSYAKWKNHFNPSIEVVPIELAGRGYRIEENLYQSMEEAVNDVYNKIVMQIDDSPYILFGHSMGSSIAYEVARKIKDSKNVSPEFLVLSGRNHPNSKIKISDIIFLMSNSKEKLLQWEVHHLGYCNQKN